MRGCEAPLDIGSRVATCPRGHSFDRARSGYWNLAQPQDRRSPEAGDSLSAALARRRLFERGHDEPLIAALRERIPHRARILDVGCGEGSILSALRRELEAEACGVDLSTAAVDLAAKADSEATWVVCNADRGLPLVDGSRDVVLSITARRPAAELRRVLRAAGTLWVTIPGADDLRQLRELVQGEAHERDRVESVRLELETHFELESHTRIEATLELDRTGLMGLLDASYRIARGRSERLARMPAGQMAVTVVRDLLGFRPRRP